MKTVLPVLQPPSGHAKSCGSEPFLLVAIASFLTGSIWLYRERELLLGHFYRPELLSITHTMTLGFTTMLMMGMLARLSGRALGVPFRSKRLLATQFVLMLVGYTGMVFHFWLSGWVAMALAAILIVAAAGVQIVNFSRVFQAARRDWLARYAAAAMVHFLLAAVLGVLLGFNKVYDILPVEFFPSIFAHAHLAAVGWVSMLILGFEHRLLPSSRPLSPREAAVRFWALEAGILGTVGGFLLSSRATPFFAALIVLALVLHAHRPLKLLVMGRVPERASVWATAALLFALAAGAVGLLLASGIPDVSSPLRARVQFAYGYVGIFGWIALTIASQSFKLFPVFLQEERNASGLPFLPIEEIRSRPLETLVGVFMALGAAGAAVGIVTQSIFAITFFHGMVVLGVAVFVVNFVRMARRHLLQMVSRTLALPGRPVSLS